MHTDPHASGHGAPLAEDDEMHVERSATPDGRLLLYFTFGPPAAAPRPDNLMTSSDAASGERQAGAS